MKPPLVVPKLGRRVFLATMEIIGDGDSILALRPILSLGTGSTGLIWSFIALIAPVLDLRGIGPLERTLNSSG